MPDNRLKFEGIKTPLLSYREWYFLFVCVEEQMFIIMDVEEFLIPPEYLVWLLSQQAVRTPALPNPEVFGCSCKSYFSCSYLGITSQKRLKWVVGVWCSPAFPFPFICFNYQQRNFHSQVATTQAFPQDPLSPSVQQAATMLTTWSQLLADCVSSAWPS